MLSCFDYASVEGVALKKEAVYFFEALLCTYKTTVCHSAAEDSVDNHRGGNLGICILQN
jgi:hypothetical protein